MKTKIPKAWYKDFKNNKLLFTRPSRVQVIKLIKRLNKEIQETKEHHINFGRFNPELIYLERHLVDLQNYLDLLSCC